MRILLIGLLFISSLLSLQAQPKEEIRATWLTTLGGMDWPTRKANSAKGIEAQKNELIRQLDALKAANFNTVLFQTRLRGDVIYPSAIETFAESLTGHTGKNPGYDPLQFAIEECHKRGLELHAWLVCIPIGNKRQVTLLGKNCVVKKQPALCKQFNKETRDGKNMRHYSDLLQSAIESIITVKEESDIDSLFSVGETSALTYNIKGLDDFELICFLVIK